MLLRSYGSWVVRLGNVDHVFVEDKFGDGVWDNIGADDKANAIKELSKEVEGSPIKFFCGVIGVGQVIDDNLS